MKNVAPPKGSQPQAKGQRGARRQRLPARKDRAAMTLQRTPLFNTHVAAGAKMVDFGGWEMPLNYGSQIDEHHAVRKAAGMFDVSHMCPVEIQGNDANYFLRVLLTNDVAKLTAPGKALYSGMLSEQGGVIDDLIVYWRGGDRYRVVVNASTAEKDLKHMYSVVHERTKNWAVEIVPLRSSRGIICPLPDQLAMIAVQGPQASKKVWQVRPAWLAATEPLRAFFATEIGDVFIGRTGYTGEDGFEIMLPASDAAALWNDLKAAGVAQCGLGARDTLRLEAGMNLYGNDMDESISPLDAGMSWTVDRNTTPARNFIGRAALDAQGQKHAFVGLKLLDKGVMRSHMKVITPHGEGETTSGTFSPTMNVSIALARVPKDVKPGETVQVEIRGKGVNALVVKPPFVRNGKVLV
jgi:aminomethyltransferase